MSDFLKGRKTYVVGGGLVALGLAVIFGFANPTPEQMEAATALLTGLGLAALRAGVAAAADGP